MIKAGRFQQMTTNFANDFFPKRHSSYFPFWKMERFFKKVLGKHRQVDYQERDLNPIWLANDEDLHADYLGTDGPSIDAQKLRRFYEMISLI